MQLLDIKLRNLIIIPHSLENQFIYPNPRGSKLIFFAPPGAGVNEENQLPFSILQLVNLTYFCRRKIKSIQISFFLGNMLYFCRPQNNGVITLDISVSIKK
jgi:hypothetical protein